MHGMKLKKLDKCVSIWKLNSQNRFESWLAQKEKPSIYQQFNLSSATRERNNRYLSETYIHVVF